ncbi:uncharacterized protein LOC128250371 [Octopus bimaculoides]|uniref:uncharacterized protein LOC128250371 n=1 Tax=Octopus bimaculoides TaxID=37653 RepID=UPI0022E4650B|nr:uncharacterized protein LOC128250371 [Octopus bimaculoides]
MIFQRKKGVAKNCPATILFSSMMESASNLILPIATPLMTRTNITSTSLENNGSNDESNYCVQVIEVYVRKLLYIHWITLPSQLTEYEENMDVHCDNIKETSDLVSTSSSYYT